MAQELQGSTVHTRVVTSAGAVPARNPIHYPVEAGKRRSAESECKDVLPTWRSRLE